MTTDQPLSLPTLATDGATSQAELCSVISDIGATSGWLSWGVQRESQTGWPAYLA